MTPHACHYTHAAPQPPSSHTPSPYTPPTPTTAPPLTTPTTLPPPHGSLPRPTFCHYQRMRIAPLYVVVRHLCCIRDGSVNSATGTCYGVGSMTKKKDRRAKTAVVFGRGLSPDSQFPTTPTPFVYSFKTIVFICLQRSDTFIGTSAGHTHTHPHTHLHTHTHTHACLCGCSGSKMGWSLLTISGDFYF